MSSQVTCGFHKAESNHLEMTERFLDGCHFVRRTYQLLTVGGLGFVVILPFLYAKEILYLPPFIHPGTVWKLTGRPFLMPGKES